MKRLLAPLLLLTVLPALAASGFTLNNSLGARFKSDKVKVRVASVSGTCNGQGTSADELRGLVDEAVDDFWNTVPTSRLQLEDGGELDTNDNDFITGELCLQGDACGGTPIPAVSDIVITCNTNATNFPGGSSLLALTLPTVIKGKNIKGAVIAVNATNDSFGSLPRHKKVAVIAHEIGHAIGLGHSGEKANLMYYSVVPKRESLGQGDIDGVTFLYPVQMDMFGTSCLTGTISTGGDQGGSGGMPSGWWPTLLAGLAVGLLLARRPGQRLTP